MFNAFNAANEEDDQLEDEDGAREQDAVEAAAAAASSSAHSAAASSASEEDRSESDEEDGGESTRRGNAAAWLQHRGEEDALINVRSHVVVVCVAELVHSLSLPCLSTHVYHFNTYTIFLLPVHAQHTTKL
jgi:hypothetical protein